MKSRIVRLAALCAFALSAFIAAAQDAQAPAASPEPGKTANQAKKFADFNLSLAPTVTGNLDGSADLTLNWLDWLQTLADFQAVNSQVFTDTDAFDSTELITTISVTLEGIRVNQSLLWRILPFRLEWLSLHAGVVVRYVRISDKIYGISDDGLSFFKDQSTTQYVKALGAAGLGFKLGPVELQGNYEASPFPIQEAQAGRSMDNTAGSLVTTDYTGADIGYETRIRGSLALALGPVDLLGNGEWYRHIGYNRFVENGIVVPFGYETIDMLFGGGLKLNFVKISGSIPYFGVDYAMRSFTPLEGRSGGRVASDVSHWRLVVSLGN